MPKKLNNKEFDERAFKIHHEKYERLEDYKGFNVKIKFLCKEHSIFLQTPKNHLKWGCSYCSGKNKKNIEI